MLILSRKLNEGVDLYFGGQFIGTVTVREIAGNKVRLSILADQSLRAVRSELTDADRSVSEKRVLEHA
jgi:carbon storage regulator CsrA